MWLENRGIVNTDVKRAEWLYHNIVMAVNTYDPHLGVWPHNKGFAADKRIPFEAP